MKIKSLKFNLDINLKPKKKRRGRHDFDNVDLGRISKPEGRKKGTKNKKKRLTGRKKGSKNKTKKVVSRKPRTTKIKVSKPRIRKPKTKTKSNVVTNKSKPKVRVKKDTSLPSTKKPMSSLTKAKIVTKIYKKSIGDLLAMMTNSSNMSRSEKNAVNMSVKRVFNMIDYIIKNEKVNELYLACIKQKLKDIKDFLSDLDSVDFKIGLYIREFGFHNDFYPEEMMEIGSPKLIDALMSFEDFVNQCNSLKGR